MGHCGIPTREELEGLVRQGKSTRQVAKHYGVCRRTVELWRRRLGITIRAPRKGVGRRVNYEKVDRLLAERRLTEGQIAMECGCSVMAVSYRYMELYPGEDPYRKETKYSRYERVKPDPFVPLGERLERVLEVKAKRVGMPLEWIKTVWLRGEAGRQVIAEGV